MAGSINLANVALGFDSSKITKGVDLSAGEMRKLNSIFQSSISAVDRYNAEMEILDKSRKTGAFTAERLVQAEAALAAKYGFETEAMRAAAKATEDLAKAKQRQIEIAKQQAANEQRYGDMLAQAQRDMATGLSLRKQVATADERNAEATRLYSSYLKQGIIDLQTYNRLLDQMKQKPPAIPSGGGNALGGDIKSTLAQYAGMAAAFQGIKSSLSLAATAESNKLSLEVLTGSAQTAKDLFSGFQKLDRESPLSRQDFSKAAQTLIGYGYAADMTLPALRQLSEISVGNADKFQSLSLAFGQVQAAGRLMGQEVLQMVNAGFNPLAEISRTTGRSMADLKKDMENGAISASMVEDAFKSATEAGGRFYGMNEQLKNSAAGQWAKMQSDVQLLATEIGTNLLPAAKAFMGVMNAGSNGSGGNGAIASAASAFSTAVDYGIGSLSDAFTNLDGESKGNALASAQEREQKRKEAADDEAIKARLQKEYGLSAEAQAAIDKKIAEKTAERHRKEREKIQELADEKKRLEEVAQEEMEQARKEFVEYEKRMEEEAKQEALETEFKRREAKIQTEFGLKMQKLKKDGEGGVTENSAPALRAGSIEAYKFMLAQKDKLAEQGEKVLKVQEDIKSVMDEQLRELKSQARFSKVR